MNKENSEELGYFNIIIAILTIYVLGALLIETFFVLPIEISKLLNFIDNTICFIFLFDFALRFKNAKIKLNLCDGVG